MYQRVLLTVLVLAAFVEGQNIDCNKKGFICKNATHFYVCVDMGGGVTQTVDNIEQTCPPNTFCDVKNPFECAELEITPLNTTEVTTASTTETPTASTVEVKSPTPSVPAPSTTSPPKPPALSTTIPGTTTITQEMGKDIATPILTPIDTPILPGLGNDENIYPKNEAIAVLPIPTIIKLADLPPLLASESNPIPPSADSDQINLTPLTLEDNPKISVTNLLNELSSGLPSLLSLTNNNAPPDISSTSQHTIHTRTIQTTEIHPCTGGGLSFLNSGANKIFSPPTPLPPISIPLPISSPVGTNSFCLRPGQFPDENSCHSYYSCSNNVRLKLICPYNMIYSPALQKCTTTKDHCINYGFTCTQVGRFPDSKSCYSYFECQPNGAGYTVTRCHCPWYSSFQPSTGQCVNSNSACGCWQTPQTCRTPPRLEPHDETKSVIFYPDDTNTFAREYILPDSYIRDTIIPVDGLNSFIGISSNNHDDHGGNHDDSHGGSDDHDAHHPGAGGSPGEHSNNHFDPHDNNNNQHGGGDHGMPIDHSNTYFRVPVERTNTYIRDTILPVEPFSPYAGDHIVPFERIDNNNYIRVSPVPLNFDIGYNAFPGEAMGGHNLAEQKWSQPEVKDHGAGQWSPTYYSSWISMR